MTESSSLSRWLADNDNSDTALKPSYLQREQQEYACTGSIFEVEIDDDPNTAVTGPVLEGEFVFVRVQTLDQNEFGVAHLKNRLVRRKKPLISVDKIASNGSTISWEEAWRQEVSFEYWYCKKHPNFRNRWESINDIRTQEEQQWSIQDNLKPKVQLNPNIERGETERTIPRQFEEIEDYREE